MATEFKWSLVGAALFVCLVFWQRPAGIWLEELQNMPDLQPGDLIFREGIGSDSLIIKALSGHTMTHLMIDHDSELIYWASKEIW